MEIKTLAVCELCSNISSISKYGVPPETLMMLRALNIENLSLSQKKDLVVCSICEKKVKNVFNLKTRYLNVEKNGVSPKVNQAVDKTSSGIHDECRLCSNIIGSNCGVILLDVLKENNIIEPFQQYLLKIDLDTIEESLICQSCQTSLCDFGSFLLSCTIIKYEESIQTSQLLHLKAHSHQESDILNESDTKPVDSSLFYTDSNESDKVNVKIEVDSNDIYNECKIANERRKEVIINKDYCCALEIKSEFRDTTASHNIDWVKEKINEDIKDECINTSDVNDIANKDIKEKVASEYLEPSITKLQLKSEEIFIKSEPEECISEMIEAKEISKQNTFWIPFQTTVVDGIVIDKCQKCTYQTITTNKDHMLSLTKSDALKIQTCQQCSYQAKYKVTVKRPIEPHKNSNQVKNLKCHTCSYQTKDRSVLRKHMLNHKNADEVEMHKCQKCTYQSRHKSYLKTHMLIHKNPDEVEMYNCQKCTFQSKYKSAFTKHMLIHKNPDTVKMYKCQECIFQSKYKDSLKHHAITHKNPDEVEMYKCQKCTYQCKYKCTFRKHMLIHKNPDLVEMHKCLKCTYQSIYKSHLKTHMLIHKNPDEVEMYKCPKCTFQSKYKCVFTKHMLVHKNPDKVEMYKCQECIFQTKYENSLKQHAITHKKPDEVEMYKCQKCTYQTKYKRVLTKHMLIHKRPDEVAMYKCQKCIFQSKYKCAFTKHMLIHKKTSDGVEMCEGQKYTYQ